MTTCLLPCIVALLSACGGGSSASTADGGSSTANEVRRVALGGVTTADAGAASDSTAAAATTLYTPCASEGEFCAFSGTRQVRYGTDSQAFTATGTDGMACSNETFGDPAPGQIKTCAFSSVATSVVAAASSWVDCAQESQTCTFSGTRRVRYGSGTNSVIGVYTSAVSCSNSVFGDPAPGVAKSCAYEDIAQDSLLAPAVTSRSSRAVWMACAGEGQFCSFTGTRAVRYGTSTAYYTGVFTDGVTCSAAVFGDPAVGSAKTCSYWTSVAIPALINPIPSGPSGSNWPIVLNATHSAAAGDVVSLQGENFGTSPRVYLDSAQSSALTIVNRFATNWIAVQLPAGITDAITLRVSNDTGTSAQVKLNAAIPLHLDATRLVPGGAFRLFGRNLLVGNATPTITVDGAAATIDLTRSDEHMLVANAPTALQPTSATVIAVDNGNGTGPTPLDRTIAVVNAGSGDPLNLGVGWAAAFSTLTGRTIATATDSRLSSKAVCNGSQDDTQAIQSAVDLAASIGGAVVTIPAGTCRLAGGIALRSNVVLQGAGKTSTTLAYESNYPIFAVGIDLAGVRNLSLVHNSAAEEAPLLKNSTRVFLQNVGINLGTSRQMFLDGNRDFVFINSDIVQVASISSQGPFLLNNSAGLVFEGNNVRWVDGAPAFGQAHESYLHANHFTRDGSHQNAGGTVHSMVLDFGYRLAVVGNTFDVANGPITNKTRNDGETILAEGGGAGRTENLGYVTSATATTVSDSGNTINVDPFGAGSIPENYGVAIVGGTGAGQTRRLVAYSQPTMTVDRAWDITPDTTSRYATFVWGLEKSLIKNNMLSQNPRGIWLYHTAIRDVDVIGNTITEGGGIYLRSYQNLTNKYFMPIYNVIIAGNKISNTTGNWMSYINSVFVNSDARAFGIATLGIEMRSNQIVANQPNVESAWEEYAGVEGYMNMMRVESNSAYESSAVPRQLGSILTNNSCFHCATVVRVGTGAGATTILNTQVNDSQTPLTDWATTSSGEKSIGTLMR